ncbi:Electron transfer flavoprotein-ubiquinone oxidoreductase [hydrothermal vent metagenome]|uniref:Electron transfer flavoprotein-ubiquinone oxidoreductase n=1 Tax=hydrothermal vent metagenome TaxID=652676 RepID=A0A3B1C937_9ZZZZ
MEYDVILVGASPSNMALAWRLVEKADTPIRIAILEKSKSLGGHLLSGAVTNPRVIQTMFPEWDKGEFPLEGVCEKSHVTMLGSKGWAHVPHMFMPPYFKKEGYAIISISNMVAFIASKIAEKAKEKEGVVVDIYPAFPARSIVYEGERVVGVKVDSTGKDELDICYAKVVVFGDKGFTSRDLISKFNLCKTEQTYAVGVKEIWETKESYEGMVWHTMGYPLPPGHLGGGFIYGCKNNKLIVGMVMGLDFANPNIRPPQALQDLKKHPFVQEKIGGGKILRYGASILPEGGYYSLPEKFAVDGALLVGDALGVLDVKRFSGVDKAMQSGLDAADTIHSALKNGDTTATGLSGYQEKLMSGWVGKELKSSRYFRKAFRDYPELLNTAIPKIMKYVDSGKGLIASGIALGLTDLKGSINLLGAQKMMDNPAEAGPMTYEKDYKAIKADYSAKVETPKEFDSETIYSTDDVVYYAHTHYEEGNNHIEEFSADTCKKCIAEYEAEGKETPCVGDCTASVHQTLNKEGVKVHAMALENCVQCRTCEIVCPYENLRVNAALHGYGPDFSGM